MRARNLRLVLLAVLLYVGLDFCAPTFGGAFVFDATDCAESVQLRHRAAADVIVVPALVAAPCLASPTATPDRASIATAREVVRPCAPATHLARAALAPPPASDDPH